MQKQKINALLGIGSLPWNSDSIVEKAKQELFTRINENTVMKDQTAYTTQTQTDSANYAQIAQASVKSQYVKTGLIVAGIAVVTTTLIVILRN